MEMELLNKIWNFAGAKRRQGRRLAAPFTLATLADPALTTF